MNWKSIEQFGGRYLVSDMGDIKSLITGKILRPATDSWGYKRVAMMNNGKLITQKVHRLVAQAFIHNPENKPQVNHINGIKTDNRVENLEWCTQSENIRHSLDIGIKVMASGETHYKSKPTLQFTPDMNLVAEWPSASSAARSLGVSPGNILSCLSNSRNYAYGFIWKYK